MRKQGRSGDRRALPGGQTPALSHPLESGGWLRFPAAELRILGTVSARSRYLQGLEIRVLGFLRTFLVDGHREKAY